MATYLIDYENVNKDGLNGVSKLTEKDKVIIFYSSRADRMTFGLHRRLNETKAVIEYRRVDVGGHNALDFQLATYLGFLISQNSSEEYCIVSNDRGFEYLAGFWREPLYHVTRTREIATSPQAEERRQHRIQEKQEKANLLSETEEIRSEFSENPDLPDIGVKTTVFSDMDHTELIVPPEDGREEFLQELKESLFAGEEKVSSFASDPAVSSDLSGGGKKVWFTDSVEFTEEMEEFSEEEPQSVDSDDRQMNFMEENIDSKQGTGEVEDIIPEYRNPAGEYRSADRRRDFSRRQQEERIVRRDAKKQSQMSSEEKLRKDVDQSVSGLELTDSDRGEIAAYISRYKTKLGLNNALVRRFGTQKAGEIYKSIKNLIRDKKGSAETKKPQQEAVLKDVRRYTGSADLTEEDIKEITSYVSRYKTKQGVNNALVRRFRSQKAGEIYKMIKPLLKDKKGQKTSAGTRNGGLGAVQKVQ